MDGAGVFFEVFDFLGAWDGEDVVAQGEEPGESELGGRAAFAGGELLDVVGEGEVLGEGIALEAGAEATPVGGVEVFKGAETTGEESAAEGAVGNEGDAEFAGCGEELGFGIAGPEGVFGLEGCDGVYGVGATDGGGGGFGESEETDLAGGDEVGHGADGFFDGSVGVDAVLVVEVDDIDAETEEAGVACGTDVFGAAVDTEVVSVGGADVAEFGGEEDLAA